jgi:hypothetical protein
VDFILSYVKKTWCCVVHLTDVLVQDKIFRSLTLLRCADCLTQHPFLGQLIIVDDLTESVEVEDKQKMLEPYQRFPMLKYSDVFGDDIAVATSCERMVKWLLDYKG